MFVAAAVVTAFWAGAARAAGGLDATFGGDGKVTTNLTTGIDGATSVAIQTDRKIVAAGGAGGAGGRFGLARYNLDGSLDTTFGGDGTVTTNFSSHADSARGVAIQADGKIVAVGGITRLKASGFLAGRFALARYNTDGSPDTSFGGDGTVTTSFGGGWDGGTAVAIQGDGQIVAAGFTNGDCSCRMFALARYDAGGTLDPAFGGDGRVTTHFRLGGGATALAIGAGGGIVAAGGHVTDADRFELARYNTDGTLDTTFSKDGKVATLVGKGETSATAVAIQSNGKVIGAGFTDNPHEFGDNFGPGKFALVRYRVDGSLDPGFGGDGKIKTSFGRRAASAYGVAIQGDGKVVAIGFAERDGGTFALARYRTDGSLDMGFGGDGKVGTRFAGGGAAALAVALQANGKIIGVGGVGGAFALARYQGR
ncbi:MAG: hypothetical protein QOI60_1657 [Actinomycetota bacterium]|nr:hypothetical protein [Actinomycetota bacterium]